MPKYEYAIVDIADPQKGIRLLLPPQALSVLTQVRGTHFDIVEDLLPSTLAKGQLVPGIVVNRIILLPI